MLVPTLPAYPGKFIFCLPRLVTFTHSFFLSFKPLMGQAVSCLVLRDQIRNSMGQSGCCVLDTVGHPR